METRICKIYDRRYFFFKIKVIKKMNKIKGTPGSPYGGSGTYGRINDLALVEKSMKDRFILSFYFLLKK